MTNSEVQRITEDEAKSELEKSISHAEKIIDDTNKIESLLDKINFKKLEKEFSKLFTMAEIIKAYIKKEYTTIPKRSILAILGAIIYFVNPLDLIPDTLPVVGHVDDLSIILVCWNAISKDIDDYITWKQNNVNSSDGE